MNFTDNYFLLNQKEKHCPSPLRDVKRKNLLRFPVYLNKIDTSERSEIIEQKSDILEWLKLGVASVDGLKEQIVYLIHDFLVWYQQRYRTQNVKKMKKFEEQGFFPFLFPSDSLNIAVSVRFY